MDRHTRFFSTRQFELEVNELLFSGPVQVLLGYGADVGAVTNLGFTALHFAASSSDNPDVVKLLAGRMTAEQIDARDKKG